MPSDTTVTALSATTYPVDDPGDLLEYASASAPLAWLRGGDGFVGIGEALRLTFSGPSRVADAAEAWRTLVASSSVDDGVGVPGTGLVALGAFTFAADAAVESVLVVPSVVVGRRGGRSWVTRIDPLDPRWSTADPDPRWSTAGAEGVRDGDHHPLPPRTPLGPSLPAHLAPGLQTAEGYRASVAAALERIEAGAVSKVVLARDLRGTLPSDADRRRPVAALANGYPGTWTFAVDGLIGASPETLVLVEGRAFESVVLAGTASRGSNAIADRSAAEALASSAKDLAEHSFAAESVAAAVRPLAASVTVTGPEAMELPNVWHLATRVTGELRAGVSSLDIVAALHPTPAVAGVPTDVALDLIAELEPFDRGRYGGPVGWIGADGSGEWAIALRSAQLEPSGEIAALAGGGIVAGSDPVLELAETTMKLRPILEAFA